MFYIKDKRLKYPSKTIVEDVLSRTGVSTVDAFTPYSGMGDLLIKRIGDVRKIDFINPADVLDDMSEFNPIKKKTAMENNGEFLEGDYAILEVDIPEKDVRSYVDNCVYHYTKHSRSALNKSFAENQPTRSLFIDNNGKSVFYEESDVIERDSRDITTDDIISATEKLPYILKSLHEGSKKYRGSLLSFIIAVEKFKKEMPGEIMASRHLINYGVYMVSTSGDIVGRFSHDDNKKGTYIFLKEWAMGFHSDDVYYKLYIELIDICYILGVDLTQENAIDYQSDFMNKMMVTYLASNREYTETYGFMDKHILNILSPDALFSINKGLLDNTDPVSFNKSMLSETIAVNTEILKFKNSNWYTDLNLVNTFLQQYLSFKKKDIKLIKDFKINKGLYTTASDVYVTVDIGFVFHGIGTKIQEVSLLSECGYLIKLEDITKTNYIRCVHMTRVCDFFEGRIYCGEIAWETINL